MDLATPPGVWSPISDSWQLAACLRRQPACRGGRVLDLCTGSGVLAIAAAEEGAEATAVDIDHVSAATAAANARRSGVTIRALTGDLFEPVVGERFDIIVSNPPYIPAPTDALPEAGPSRAWVGGRDGRLLLDGIIDGALGHLAPGGVLLLVQSSLIGEGLTLDRLHRAGYASAGVIARHLEPLGPLMREQQRLGTVPADADHEDVVVIRADAADEQSAVASTRTGE